MNFLDQILGRKKEEEDTEFDEIVREAKRQVEFNRKIGSIVLAFIILIVGLYIHFFWDKPDAGSITVNLTIECGEAAGEGVPSGGYFVNKNVFVVPEGGSAEDLLNKFSEKKEITVETAGGEIMSIGGIERYQFGNSSWHIAVNDSEIKTPIGDTILENNDVVRIYYE